MCRCTFYGLIAYTSPLNGISSIRKTIFLPVNCACRSTFATLRVYFFFCLYSDWFISSKCRSSQRVNNASPFGDGGYILKSKRIILQIQCILSSALLKLTTKVQLVLLSTIRIFYSCLLGIGLRVDVCYIYV